jgi:hypothetical protein
LILIRGYLSGGSPYAAASVGLSEETAIKSPSIRVSNIGEKLNLTGREIIASIFQLLKIFVSFLNPTRGRGDVRNSAG